VSDSTISHSGSSVAGFDPGAVGVTPPANPARRGAFLADVIVELGFADREIVDEIVELARRSGRTMERSLLESGVLDEAQLSLAIAERNGLDHVDLDSFDADMEAAEMVGRSTAFRYGAVPIAFASDGALIIAVEDPVDSLGISDIEVMTRSEVRLAIATPSAIQRLAARLPDDGAAPSPPAGPEPRAHELQVAVSSGPEIELPASRDEPPASRDEPPASRDEPPASRDEPPASRDEPPAFRNEPPASRDEPPASRNELPPPGESDPGERALSIELRELQETVRRAEALTATVGERVGELEGAEERARRLDQELVAAREHSTELEQRLSRVAATAEEAWVAAEQLGALHRTLKEISP